MQFAKVLAESTPDDSIIFCACELFRVVYYDYFTNVSAWKNAANNLINKMECP